VSAPTRIIPIVIPSKTRLQATLKEMHRLVGLLPEPACLALEKSGVVLVWRSQLETLVNGVSMVTDGWKDPLALAQKIRRMVHLR
jgi:hypothetical protein